MKLTSQLAAATLCNCKLKKIKQSKCFLINYLNSFLNIFQTQFRKAQSD